MNVWIKRVVQSCQQWLLVLWQWLIVTCRKFSDFHQASWARDEGHKRFKKTPCYLVLGSPKSGKTQWLRNQGLLSVSADHYGRHAESLSQQWLDQQWHCFQEGIFIEQNIQDDAGELIDLKPLLKQLKRRRSKRCISGVALTFSLPELLLAKHEDRREFINKLIMQIRSIHQQAKAVVPVYVLLTKADLISGFAEFFSDMSKEDIAQVWGVSFGIDNQQSDHMVATFDQEYSQMMARLSQRVLWTMDAEKNQQARDMIYRFPQQMQLFRQPMACFLQELLQAQQNDLLMYLRGMYFISAEQKGEPYNFFLEVIGKRFELTSPYHVEQEQHNESYFIYRLIKEVILPEASVFSLSRRQSRWREMMYRLLFIFTPALALASALTFHQAYQQTQSTALAITDQIATFKMANNKLMPNDAHLIDTLPALNALHQAHTMAQHGYLHRLLLVSHALSSATSQALNRAIHVLYLPRVAANLEARLQQGGLTTNAMYAYLKGYLAFSPSHYTDADAIKAPMSLMINRDNLGDPGTIDQLRYYLQRASHLPIDRLPLDQPLISKVRLNLQHVVPAKRAYALLTIKALASDLPDITIESVIGSSFTSVFAPTRADVPALYTQKGFVDIYLRNSESIAEQVADDNKEIGLHADHQNTQSLDQIETDVQSDYNHNYLQAWKNTLQSVRVKKFTNFSDAANALTSVSGNQSPITQLLAIVSENTDSVSSDGISISDQYQKLNNYSQSGLLSTPWSHDRKVLQKLAKIMQGLSQAANPDQAAWQQAKLYIQQSQNPLRELSRIAKTAPKPLQSWLQALVNNSWSLINAHALAYINHAWQQQVLTEYTAHIRARYPLHKKAKREVSPSAFSHFFKRNGTMDKFFNHYVSAFVDRSKTPWHCYLPNGIGLSINDHDIDIFEQVKKIQSMYFDPNSGQLSLRFAIKPIDLDANARDVVVRVGDKQLRYAHGPQQPLALQWPFTNGSEQTQLIITGFNQRRDVFSDYGAWSVFRIFANHGLHQMQDGSGYAFSISMGGHRASFELLSDAPMAAFDLAYISGMKLPVKL